MKYSTVEDYLLFLRSKGFHFKEDVKGFIFFGQHLTNSSVEMVILAIEATLKSQKKFDGSLYVSLLEALASNKIMTEKEARSFINKTLSI